MTVLSVVTARTNAELIEYIAPLWIPEDALTLDATYGKGNWWTRFKPKMLYTNDIDPGSPAFDRYDFRDLPRLWGDRFDVIAFDPDYIAKGGRDTSGIAEFDQAFGLDKPYESPAALFYTNSLGIREAARCLSPGGVLLVKCMDYISSGRYVSGYAWAKDTAAAVALELVDVFIHHSGTGPQPKFNRACPECGHGGIQGTATDERICRKCGFTAHRDSFADGTPRRQVHSRRRHSYLMIFRKGKRQ